jgi:hypothetical protein
MSAASSEARKATTPAIELGRSMARPASALQLRLLSTRSSGVPPGRPAIMS